jgi:hypothetical protein
VTRRESLQAFVTYCEKYIKGDEKGEAQVFLDHFFMALGYPDGIKEAQGVGEHRIKFTLDEHSPTKFADLVIPGRVLIEMKKRGVDLQTTQLQALDYWKYLTPHPRYVVTCNFDEFWVYDMDVQVDAPLGKIILSDLPTNWDALAFLFPGDEKPHFNPLFNQVDLTKEAAVKLGEVFRLLSRPGREGGDLSLEQAQTFVLQCIVALFAEDIGLLPRRTFTNMLDDCIADPARSPERFTALFFAMNTQGPKGGFYHYVDYFNGGLFDFKHISMLYLGTDELRLLREAANYNWSNVRPAIFGAIFEESLREQDRHAAGIHFTSERDILRIVEPVIVRPWSDRIKAATTTEALRALHTELRNYRVLDPACGSGNFLYVAYREMKRLEKQIFDRLLELGDNPYPEPITPKTEAKPAASNKLTARAEYVGPAREEIMPPRVIYPDMPLVNIKQFHGIDIKPFAVELAKVTLMIAKKLAIDELNLPENALPLDNLDNNLQAADALLTDWPEFDACIGNPPYMGAKRLKQEMPPEYINQVRAAFPDVPGNADYCVYWFNKAHRRMHDGARAGLVATNTVRQNYSREGGLDIIVRENGRIFEAVSSMPWSGDAAVHVSIACWEKQPHPLTASASPQGSDGEQEMARLWVDDGETPLELPFINSSLSPKTDVSGAKVLAVNREPKRVFIGQQTGHEAFILEPSEAAEMVRADKSSTPVIYPFLIGRELVANAGAKPQRYVIDMNAYDLIDAQQFRRAYKHIETHVLPFREHMANEEAIKNKRVLEANPKAKVNKHHTNFLKQWWKHAWGRPQMLTEIGKLSRFIVCPEVSKRPIFELVSSKIRPDHKLIVFTFEDDYSFGILQSNFHWQWWLTRGATLKSDPAYTPNTIYDTFPWPQNPTPVQVKAVADSARALHEFRRERMAKSERLSLRDLYRSLEQPGKNPLRDLHTALDAAVMAAYGFESSGDILAQLLALNLEVARKIEAGEAVTAPGIPGNYPDPAELVSEGCITPPELI